MNLNELFETGLSFGTENDDANVDNVPEEVPFDELGIECLFAEYAAVDRRMARFGELFDQTLINKSICRGVAMEALELYPDFDNGRSAKLYTEFPTQTRYKVAVEEFTKGQMLLGAGLGAILIGIIWRILKWLFTGENATPPSNVSARDVTKLVAAEHVPAETEIKATEQTVAVVENLGEAIEAHTDTLAKMRGYIKMPGNRKVIVNSSHDIDKVFFEMLESDKVDPNSAEFDGPMVRSMLNKTSYTRDCISICKLIEKTAGEYESALTGIISDTARLTDVPNREDNISKDEFNAYSKLPPPDRNSFELRGSTLADNLQFVVKINGTSYEGRAITEKLRAERDAVTDGTHKYKTMHDVIYKYCKPIYDYHNVSSIKDLCKIVDGLVLRFDKLSRSIETVDDAHATHARKNKEIKSGQHLTGETATLLREITGKLREQVSIIREVLFVIKNDLTDYHRALKHILRIQYVWLELRTNAIVGDLENGDQQDIVKFMAAVDMDLLEEDSKLITKERTYVMRSGVNFVQRKILNKLTYHVNKL